MSVIQTVVSIGQTFAGAFETEEKKTIYSALYQYANYIEKLITEVACKEDTETIEELKTRYQKARTMAEWFR